MDSYLIEACENIDVAIFSGDEFINLKSIAELREYMARWERGLTEHEKSIEEESQNE